MIHWWIDRTAYTMCVSNDSFDGEFLHERK